jgi:hypothetical protein
MPETADLAYGRDASFYEFPDVRSVKALHLPRNPDEPILPRCTPNMYLDEFTSRPVANVPENARCMRNGCRQGWPS